MSRLRSRAHPVDARTRCELNEPSLYSRTYTQRHAVLFVCTGNICRSPIAERLASAWSARSDTIDLTVASAGTRAVVGSPMEPKAAQVLSDLGGSPDGFVARQINPAVASSADLVLTMTEEHRDAVLKLSPRHLKRTFTLLEAAHIARALGRER
ncbi:hypothetical protein GS432_01275 [Rhodococcus hoagii]|nr:hypothetical protein [Prescottella equi]